MKNLLFVTSYVPPRPGIATNRCSQLLQRLPELGWDVVTVTTAFPGRGSDDPAIIQTRQLDLKGALRRLMGVGDRSTQEALAVADAVSGTRVMAKRIVNFAYAVTAYPDPEIGWLPYGTAAVKRLVKKNRFDVVLSSSLPVTSHFIVALSAARRLPWVADLRDLWSQNHYLVTSRARATVDRFLERLTLKNASALTTVSQPLANKLMELFPTKPIYSVPNAFDEDDWRDIQFGRENRCTIVYTGQFTEGRRDPRLLFSAISDLVALGSIDSRSLAVDLYTTPYAWLRRMIAHYGLADIVHLKGVLPRREVMAAQRRADALLVALWDHPAEEGVYTGKLFEYIGSERPILAFGGPQKSVVEDLLVETGYGWRCRDFASIRCILLKIIGMHKQGIHKRLDLAKARHFSSQAMAQKFSAILEMAVRHQFDNHRPTSPA